MKNLEKFELFNEDVKSYYNKDVHPNAPVVKSFNTYLKNIIAAGVLIIDYVNSKKGDYTPLDTSMDSRDYKSNRKTSSKGKFDRGYY